MAEDNLDEWLTSMIISTYVFLIIYLTVKVMHAMHSRTKMINRLSLWPFYLVIMCYTTAVIFLCIAAANEGNGELQSNGSCRLLRDC